MLDQSIHYTTYVCTICTWLWFIYNVSVVMCTRWCLVRWSSSTIGYIHSLDASTNSPTGTYVRFNRRRVTVRGRALWGLGSVRSFCLMCTSLFIVYALQFVHWVISVRQSVSRLCPLCFDVLFTMHGKNGGMWGRGGIAGGSRQGPWEAHTEGVFGTVYCFLVLLPHIVTLVCPTVTFPPFTAHAGTSHYLL